MAKRKSKNGPSIFSFTIGPEERRKMAARDMARTLIDTAPAIKAREADLEREILAAGKRVMSGSRPLVKAPKRPR